MFQGTSKATSKIDEDRKNAAQFKWGNEFDIEVNINIIYALARYDYAKYKNYIKKCIKWLELKQEKDGGWDNTWYALDNYSCYLVSKLVKVISLNNDIFSK